MNITFPNGTKLTLEFSYEVALSTKALLKLESPNGETRAMAAIAKCDSRDQFTKSSGRRASLRRLLLPDRFSRETRAVIWATYFSHHNDLHLNADRQLKRSLEYARVKLTNIAAQEALVHTVCIHSVDL